jgi:hypothetical protein
MLRRFLHWAFPWNPFQDWTVNIDGYEGKGPTHEIAEARAYRARCIALHS